MDDAVSIGSIDSSTTPKCRICGENDGSLISPCDCSGTIAYVHGTCMDRWIAVQKHSKCPMCRSEYAKKFTGMKPIRQWLRPGPVDDSENFQVVNSCKMYATFVWLFCIVPMVVLPLALISLSHEVNNRNKVIVMKIIADIGWLNLLIIVAVFLAAGCFIGITFETMKHFSAIFKQWIRDNQHSEWTDKKKKKANGRKVEIV